MTHTAQQRIDHIMWRAAMRLHEARRHRDRAETAVRRSHDARRNLNLLKGARA